MPHVRREPRGLGEGGGPKLGTRGGMAYPEAAGGVGVVLVESERACLATTFGNPASMGGVGLRWG